MRIEVKLISLPTQMQIGLAAQMIGSQLKVIVFLLEAISLHGARSRILLQD